MPTSSPIDPAGWARVRALFDQLQDLPADQREAALAALPDSPAVVSELRSLLQHAAQATGGTTDDGFLAGAAAQRVDLPASGPDVSDAGQAPDALPSRAGERLGPWCIDRLLGRGGMGEVWHAQRADGAYEGQAAIKVLRPGQDSRRVLERFALEQRALARLNHPHIAHLLDAGRTADGLPYFVMEAVDGQPIDRACKTLTLEQRLALFLQLADAVSHAHRQLLVHRDLKPSNVLVNREGQVKLLDFGIAKAIDPLEGEDGHHTVAGERPFTPNYASPEQVRGEPVGTGTDLYSLGVLLYEMLTGLRPYGRQATTAKEAARSVLQDEPTRPSALSPGLVADPQWMATRRRLVGDLDNILLKALDKTLEGRYPSVDLFAADIRAFLAGFPVSARAPSAGYLIGKFVRRHKAAAAASLAAVLALAVGLGLALWQAQVADAQRAVAQQRFKQVRQMANQLVFKYHDQIENLPGATSAREALLLDAAQFLDNLAQAARTDLALADELASTYYRISRLQGVDTSVNIGKIDEAEINLNKALALAATYERSPEVSTAGLNSAISMHISWAELLQRRGQVREAEAALRDTLPLLDAAYRRDPKDNYAQTYALSSAITLHGVMARVLGSHLNVASLGRWREACASADLARKAADEMLVVDPGNNYGPDSLAFTVGEQARCQEMAGHLDAAQALYTQQITLRDRMAERFPNDMDFRYQRAISRQGMAGVLSAQGQHAAARQLLATALQWVREAQKADAGNHAGQRLINGLEVASAVAALAAGDAAAARQQLEAVLPRLAGQAGAPFGAVRARFEALLWAARAWQGSNKKRALTYAVEAAELMRPAREQDDNVTRRWLLAMAWGEQAQAQAALGQPDAARRLAQQAMQAWQATPPADGPPPALTRWVDAARALAAP